MSLVSVFVHRRPRARRGATRLVSFYFLRSGAAFISPVSRFLDGRAKSITLRSKWPARATVHRSFCFPARIDDDSKTVGRAGQSSSPYEIGANSAQAAAPFGRGSDRAHGAHPRAQTTPRAEAHGRSKVARFSGASFPRASVRSSAFTQPSPARRPRRCAAAQQNLTRGDRRLWRNPV